MHHLQIGLCGLRESKDVCPTCGSSSVQLRYVERVLSDPRHPWTAGLDGAGGAELLARVGVKVAGVPVYKHVKLDLGQPPVRIGSNRMLMSVSWHTSGGPPLFPVLEGPIEVEGASAEQTTLSLKANYAPPLEGWGGSSPGLSFGAPPRPRGRISWSGFVTDCT